MRIVDAIVKLCAEAQAWFAIRCLGVALTATLILTLFEEAQSVILSENEFAAWVKDLSLSNIHADSGIDGAGDEI
jgi:hypothetical protein